MSMSLHKKAILSDLFFNQDHSDCVGEEGYDWDLLRKKAHEFSDNINCLNEAKILSGDEVLEDFQNRL